MREQAERMGCATDLVPISTTGTVRRNARTLCDWLAVQPDRPVILVSLSKGGPDVKVALAEPDAEPAFRNVVAWISLCGILDGTRMADWLLSWSPGAVLVRLYYRLAVRARRSCATCGIARAARTARSIVRCACRRMFD